jgi:nitrate reductase cytochrome c-type subunit
MGNACAPLRKTAEVHVGDRSNLQQNMRSRNWHFPDFSGLIVKAVSPRRYAPAIADLGAHATRPVSR